MALSELNLKYFAPLKVRKRGRMVDGCRSIYLRHQLIQVFANVNLFGLFTSLLSFDSSARRQVRCSGESRPNQGRADVRRPLCRDAAGTQGIYLLCCYDD